MTYAVLRHFLTRQRLKKLQPFLVLAFFLAVAVIAVNWWKEDRRGTPITVYNKVTKGLEMTDTGAGYLSSRTVNSCRVKGCPEAAQSSLWYRVTDDDGNAGYLAEVWVVRDQRGGLGLPNC
ncbi:hypothetical protein [Actinoplanes solisilvae]|uniref:hypothetical protein n=1 Tax=Actinoplanes solisilvae TaxID=2486853 RepID=UPI000FDADCB5|nr:hypothetical protein [Actinoplanes solisilvae]